MLGHRWVAASLLALGIGAAAIAPAHAAPPPALAACASCHDLTSAKKKIVGPPLFGVYNRKPSITGVPFKTWNKASLDKWLSGPSKIKPGTAMTFSVPDPKARAQAIQALQKLK
jgi:cytochrome c